MDSQAGVVPNSQFAGGWDAVSGEISLVDYLLLTFFSKKSTCTGRKKLLS